MNVGTIILLILFITAVIFLILSLIELATHKSEAESEIEFGSPEQIKRYREAERKLGMGPGNWHDAEKEMPRHPGCFSIIYMDKSGPRYIQSAAYDSREFYSKYSEPHKKKVFENVICWSDILPDVDDYRYI